ncbi:DNA (cytosine-5)-methyltransferase 1 [Bosea sp. BE271]|uniref:DNA cytosine methyltransferase n=1 Tax=Bosea TaxID=85413 RepID=UPI00285906A2|nr:MULTISPECIES: DNA cytosine methyltransferase [Bosea]MDR6829612.1 DNA (cytosine-5)-methyltransferase 1 [Bosea robiniae]MDR6896495.1 DNA (cytosine-5)-methyltransferase 1 [Bosea sp. BE109]MDR7139893.1 DNA (cytosine-5)-methyltransferase 1 [Bosea sp. BE168]MDR7176793.1 DNA (cytosine-5)-methyltransferase 1 [Bosea sp. BE271]
MREDATGLTVIDLFSGAGGMSVGFARRGRFTVVGAVDIEQGKPCAGRGSTSCNSTYSLNIGVDPVAEDLMVLEPCALRAEIKKRSNVDVKPGTLGVLIACPPCTDFSRAKPTNHLVDGSRNDLVGRVGDYVEYFRPRHVVMENAREFLRGRFSHHAHALTERFRRLGYSVRTEIHFLSEFGLPQIRERALIVASRVGTAVGLEALWSGLEIDRSATHVRSALRRVDESVGRRPDDGMNVAPGLRDEVRNRLDRVPRDGGSWFDLPRQAGGLAHLTPSMRKRWDEKDLGSHPDVYGRMWWDRPAPTIKRECAHIGNGRYAHPTETRLLTVREMASLQGFPLDYRFIGALASRYRQIGDAVPPVISYQIAALIEWIESGIRPQPADFILPGSVLKESDVNSALLAAAE